MPTSSRKPDTDYEIDALSNGLKVLEAMEGSATMAIQTRRVQMRTGLSYNFCLRALKTLKLAGYVAEVEGGWKLTPRIARISGKFTQAIKSDSDISEFKTNRFTDSKAFI